MRRIADAFATATRWLHYLSGALIVGLMFMTVANILGRWTMGRPVRGSVELTEIGMVAIVFLGLAYAQIREDHIRVDLVYERLGPRGRRVLGIFAATVSLATVFVLTWRLYDYVGILAASRRTTSALSIPLFWVGWVAVVGSLIYAVGVLVTGFRRATDEPPGAELPRPDAEIDGTDTTTREP
jgi:TRAP-type transport system small permease protein